MPSRTTEPAAGRSSGNGFSFFTENGEPIRDRDRIAWLRALAVPPAYTDVRYAADPSAHLQGVGLDAAGRRQYRYHPKWADVREDLKAHRLKGLAKALPAIRAAVGRGLASDPIDRRFAVAAVVELVSLSALRAGSEEYARERGTRGATTLLKSNIRLEGDNGVALSFKAKGGKAIAKDITNGRFRAALMRLMELPGARVFQYRDEAGRDPGRPRERCERFPARGGGPTDLAQGFPHPGGLWRGPCGARSHAAGGDQGQAAAPGAGGGDRSRRGACQHAHGVSNLVRP
jgi:DNA topoisomerase IB